MASQSSGFYVSDEFTKCSLCFDTFDEPKLLPCQHTFCVSCLQSYTSSQTSYSEVFPCPLCKAETKIPGGNVTNFKRNLLLQQILESSVENKKRSIEDFVFHDAKVSEKDIGKCSLCEEFAQITTFCMSCKMWLCKRCALLHKKLPASINDVVYDCSELNAM